MNAPTRKRESGEKVSSNENSNQPCVMSDNTIMVSFKRNLWVQFCSCSYLANQFGSWLD